MNSIEDFLILYRPDVFALTDYNAQRFDFTVSLEICYVLADENPKQQLIEIY